MEETDESGWVTNPTALETIWGLRAMEPGDLIRISNGDASSLGGTDGEIGVVCGWGSNLDKPTLRFDFLPSSKYHIGRPASYWILVESIGAWKRRTKPG